MSLTSDQGVILGSIESREPILDGGVRSASVDGFDRVHHSLIWSRNSSLEVRTPRLSLLVAAPFALWVPVEHPYSVETGAPWWMARFVAGSCPPSWHRLTHVEFDDVAGPMMEHLARSCTRPWSVHLLSAVVDHVHESFVARPLPIRFPTDPRARDVADALVADPSCPMELADFSSRVGASVTTLRRLFTEQTGLPFGRWRLQLRVHTAMRLLDDAVPVREVARRCGYGSAATFARAFAAETGLNPSEFSQRTVRRRSDRLDSSRIRSSRSPDRSSRSLVSGEPVSRLLEQLTGDDMNGWNRASLLAAAGVLLTVAACGSDGSSSDAADPASSSTSAADVADESEETAQEDADESESESEPADESATVAPGSAPGSGSEPVQSVETRVFVDSLGREVEVPDAPQRIVSADAFNIVPQVLSLGGPLIGIPDETVDDIALNRYYADELAAIEGRIGSFRELNLEAIAALKPDLIIWGAVDSGFATGGLDDEGLAQFERIAPVVAINHFQPVEDMMADYAELLGPSATVSVDSLQAEFAEALAGLEESFAPLRDELDVASVVAYDGGQDVFGTDFFLIQDIWTRIGANWTDIMDEADGTADRILTISEEQFERLESDLLVVQAGDNSGMLESPVYENLEVVRSGQVILLDDSAFGQHYQAYINLIGTYREFLETTDLRTDIVG
ncbi:MAG: helix-turn-helix domain-containing protein [Actinomycetota bacterium]